VTGAGRLGALAAAASVGSAAGLELGVGLALATLVSEDLTCIAAGLLVANGRLGFGAATLACFLGIFVGDLLLVAAGRWLGRPAIERRPLRWLVSAGAVERSARWFARRGPIVVFASRFLPGSRLPLFVAAGVLRAPILPLAAALAVAGAIWTPLLVGLSAATGGAIRRELELWGGRALPLALVAGAIVLLVVEILVPALTWRGRRLLLSRWRRATRWEFWPLPLFQLPVALAVAALGLRFRGATIFTAANPGIPAGGFVLESKSSILGAIGDREAVPAFRALDLPDEPAARIEAAAAAHAELGGRWPVVGKPDRGERGAGVTVVRTPAELATWALGAPREAILQEHVGGEEFGVFYVRRPSEASGWIFSITSKEFPEVVGDGRRTLEELVLADERAVCQARLHLDRLASRLDEVPAPGERIRLVEIGNHCRGTTFRDGRSLETPELARRIDEIARSFPGFHFGRFDLRAPSVEAFRAGRGLRVLELNGVTSEATHVYEPGSSLLEAYRTLFRQWRLAFEIGRENLARGARATSARELLGLLAERRRRAAAAVRAAPSR
jgi:membrane protein DedA with SNARE-associated domain